MTEVVLNGCYGGFSLSRDAIKYMADNGCKKSKELLNKDSNRFFEFLKDSDRYNPLLVEAVKFLGKEAGGKNASLHVEKIKGDKFRIVEYDGQEYVETPDSIIWEVIEK